MARVARRLWTKDVLLPARPCIQKRPTTHVSRLALSQLELAEQEGAHIHEGEDLAIYLPYVQ
eukprot:scaffold248607_cov31-Tisochrysis_lutea.AAC.5